MVNWEKLLQWCIDLLRRGQTGPTDPAIQSQPLKPLPMTQPSPQQPTPPTAQNSQPQVFLWDTPKHSWHAVRVLCDEAELTLEQKNTLCGCVYQESQFYNYEPNGVPVQFHNKDKTGHTWSTDWGLAQVNDHFHIGPGKDFPSVVYVLKHPDKPIGWMVDTMKRTGRLDPWSSFTSGAYKKWLLPDSPMWLLAK